MQRRWRLRGGLIYRIENYILQNFPLLLNEGAGGSVGVIRQMYFHRSIWQFKAFSVLFRLNFRLILVLYIAGSVNHLYSCWINRKGLFIIPSMTINRPENCAVKLA